jgi:hypothetical protein
MSMVENTWSVRELPILEAVYRAMEAGDEVARAARLSVPDLPDEVYAETIASLAEAGYLDATVIRNASGGAIVHPNRLRPMGRQAIHQWPSHDAAFELDRALARLEESESDPERKSRFRRLRAAVGDAGKDVVARTLAELIKSMPGSL